MSEKMKKTTQFRNLLLSDKTELIPFGVLPIHAQMAERAGFKAFWISGGFSSWWLTGKPDVGLMTRTEIIENARRVVQSVDIPIYCDADTGYGGIQNVRQTVHDFINAGVAGIHIEDQVEPKKAGGQAGIQIVSDEEAIGRLRCACAARDELDPDFVIVARTDGYAVPGGGLEEALRRGNLYLKETDVDCIFYEGIRTWEDCEYLLKNTNGPAYVIASYHAGITPSTEELTAMGQAIQLVTFVTPGVQEVWKMLLKVRNSGNVAVLDEYTRACHALIGTEEYVGWGDIFVKPSYKEVRELEEKYLPKSMQRDYEGGVFD